MLRMVTIGIYGFDGESFPQRLRQTDVRLLLDVRQRRGVRGSEYAWANSLRLQAALARAGIAYEHHPELAPTTELRRLDHDPQNTPYSGSELFAGDCFAQASCSFPRSSSSAVCSTLAMAQRRIGGAMSEVTIATSTMIV